MTYYDDIALGYNSLHGEEQKKKLSVVNDTGIVMHGDKLLDVGCGTGFSLDYFGLGDATGIDPSAKLIEQYDGIHKVQVGFAESLPFADNEFDVIISMTAMQNFTDLNKGLNEIKRVGKKRFALTTLKKIPRAGVIEKEVREVFSKFLIERIEEEKDYVFIIRKE